MSIAVNDSLVLSSKEVNCLYILLIAMSLSNYQHGKGFITIHSFTLLNGLSIITALVLVSALHTVVTQYV